MLGLKQRARFVAAYFADIVVEGFFCHVTDEHADGDIVSFPPYIVKVLSLVLFQVQCDQLRDAKGRVEQNQKQGLVAFLSHPK